LAQFDIFPNPGKQKVEIPFLVVVQNDHITSHTGASVVIPLRANTEPVPMMAPWVDVPGHGHLVLSVAEIFTIDAARLKHAVASLTLADRVKIKPALDKVIGEY
jgi:mRNA-degrading endonuclease toxin of MazEF toxin-antitoxin module